MNDAQEPSGDTPWIAPDLVAMLACPIDHAALRAEDRALVCTACGRRYPVADGIPNMLVEPS